MKGFTTQITIYAHAKSPPDTFCLLNDHLSYAPLCLLYATVCPRYGIISGKHKYAESSPLLQTPVGVFHGNTKQLRDKNGLSFRPKSPSTLLPKKTNSVCNLHVFSEALHESFRNDIHNERW